MFYRGCLKEQALCPSDIGWSGNFHCLSTFQAELLLKQLSESHIRTGSTSQPITKQHISEEEVIQSSRKSPATQADHRNTVDDVNTNNNNLDVGTLPLGVADVGFGVKLRKRPTSAPATRHGRPTVAGGRIRRAVQGYNSCKAEQERMGDVTQMGVYGKNATDVGEDGNCRQLVAMQSSSEEDFKNECVFFDYPDVPTRTSTQRPPARRVQSATHWRQPHDFHKDEERSNKARHIQQPEAAASKESLKLALKSSSVTMFDRPKQHDVTPDDVTAAGFVTYTTNRKEEGRAEVESVNLLQAARAAKASVCMKCGNGSLCYTVDDVNDDVCGRCLSAEEQILAIEDTPAAGSFIIKLALRKLAV